jgi:hypothetical protein
MTGWTQLPVFLPDSLYRAAEAAGIDMRQYEIAPLLPTYCVDASRWNDALLAHDVFPYRTEQMNRAARRRAGKKLRASRGSA